jgi:hypothetical protein
MRNLTKSIRDGNENINIAAFWDVTPYSLTDISIWKKPIAPVFREINARGYSSTLVL